MNIDDMELPDIDKAETERNAVSYMDQYRRSEATPLKDMINEARFMVRALGPDAMKTRIGHIHHFTDPASFTDAASHLRQKIENELSGRENDLEARLVKQAQSLDSLYDFFLQLSQYTLTEGVQDVQAPVNLALKAQSQYVRTIEKFKILQEKRFKMAERTEQTPKRTEQNATLD